MKTNPLERRPYSEDAEDLREMTQTKGWQDVAKSSLRQQMAVLAERLATNRRMEIIELRVLQERYAVLAEILEDPVTFFQIPV